VTAPVLKLGRARVVLPILLLAGALVGAGGSAGWGQDKEEAFVPNLGSLEDLPAGPGQEETFYTCTGCHGVALIKAQGMDRQRWDATVQLMIEAHNMPEPPAEERAAIVDYLAQHFPPRTQSRQGGWQNPFLKP